MKSFDTSPLIHLVDKEQASNDTTQQQQHNDTTPQEQMMESEGCNNGTTPQEQQTEAQQPEGNEGQANTEQQPDDNEGCDDLDNDNGQMYLFSDDESNEIEDESEEDTVQTEQHHSKRNFISIQQKIEIAEAAISITMVILRASQMDE